MGVVKVVQSTTIYGLGNEGQSTDKNTGFHKCFLMTITFYGVNRTDVNLTTFNLWKAWPYL